MKLLTLPNFNALQPSQKLTESASKGKEPPSSRRPSVAEKETLAKPKSSSTSSSRPRSSTPAKTNEVKTSKSSGTKKTVPEAQEESTLIRAKRDRRKTRKLREDKSEVDESKDEDSSPVKKAKLSDEASGSKKKAAAASKSKNKTPVPNDDQVDELHEDEGDTNPTVAAAVSSGPKQLIRPSKLGGFGAGDASGGFFSTSQDPSSSSRLFGSSPAELIVEGKRQWKPSFKIQESMEIKKSITQYATAISCLPPGFSSSTSSHSSPSTQKKAPPTVPKESKESHEKIQRILASQWDSRLRKVDNKFVKTSRISLGVDQVSVELLHSTEYRG